MRRAAIACILGAWTTGACVTVESPLGEGFTERPFSGARPPQERLAGGAFAGLVLEERIAGTLEELAFLPGLRVAEVVAGSPAETAGLQPGDAVLSVDGLQLQRLDQWSALLDAHAPGDRLALEVERASGLHDVELELGSRGRADLPPARRFFERLKGRLIVETVMRREGAGLVGEVVVVELLEESPFAIAGFRTGDVVTAVDGQQLTSAAALIDQLEDQSFGETLQVTGRQEGRPWEGPVRLWAPPRRLTQLEFWPLFTWGRSGNGSEASFSVVDLWLIALFDYKRDGETRRYRILRFFGWETGTGELVDLLAPLPDGEER